jgi:hypothetical protein
VITFSTDPQRAEQQMHAVIFYLVTFGYIDGDFDPSEKQYIREYIRKLVDFRARQAMGAHLQQDVVTRWTQHFHEVLDEIDGQIQANFHEPVANGVDPQQYVLAKLKLRCFELFKSFDEDNRSILLESVDELMHADGVIHPNEKKFREELQSLLDADMELDAEEIETVGDGSMVIDAINKPEPRETDHPFFTAYEWDYVKDPSAFAQQARTDMDLLEKAMGIFDAQREKGEGKLKTAKSFADFAGQDPFLDGHVYCVAPKPGQEYELLVLGDLHGCYSCLKAALMQADFFDKVQKHHNAPDKNPLMKLVLLGDYIDRGRFSYNGVLRSVLNLLARVPEHVYVLRGNHEYYVEINGKVYGAVRPSEAMNSLQDVAPNELFETYMRLFESMPNMLAFDRMLFVHAGIPREDTIAQKWQGLQSLNDPEIRFQMLWSDPSEAEVIPLDLQKANARFPFGRKQFKSFMARLGLQTMVRGHERVTEGFKKVYDDADGTLLNLFSAGGKHNDDLPADSNYREVRPMALTIRHKDGINTLSPFEIDYARYNDPKYNAFFSKG